MSSTPVVLSATEWVPSKVKYMPPKVNERGGKTINMISTQSNRSLHITTPMMMTWGVADFIGDNGESDGKYSISLNFPNDEYRKPATDAFLQKLKDFENQILDDAVKNSDLWWGEEMSREVCKHTFFPFLKYSKNKDTKKIDLSKPPSIRAKVPYYDGKWRVEIYDTKDKQIFPSENDMLTPVDFIPKLSQVACVLQCGGIWIGGKGWGLTWKLIQCVVKPREVVSVYGRCHIQLSSEDRVAIDTQQIKEDVDVEEEEEAPVQVSKPAPTVFDTSAADSDAEEEEAEPVVESSSAAAAVAVEPEPVVKKKVVKKAVPAAEPELAVAVAAESEPAKKKVVKKKVVA
jgi:Protein of unknown function (DUF2738)